MKPPSRSSKNRIKPRASLQTKLARIKLFLCDVDGVLTNGTVSMNGHDEMKQFHIRDGLGLRLLQKNGIKIGWISNRPSSVTLQRATELKVDFLSQDKSSKVDVVNSVNPVRIEGQKTASFEICDVLGDAPNFHFLPVGNAGNITAYWKGFKEYKGAGFARRLPRMFGFQAAGAAPIVDGHPVADPQTVATAIRIGNPAGWQGATDAVKESSGHIGKVTDEEILHAYKLIARSDGVLVEPASAAPLAGLIKCVAAGMIPAGSIITATMTGHGLKDPDTAITSAGFEPIIVPANKKAVMKVMGL